jgi:hypothetical protein
MGAQEDAAAAADHYNYVVSQTSDPNQREAARQNMLRAQARAGMTDGSGGGFKMPGAITAISRTLNWLSGTPDTVDPNRKPRQ